MQNNEYLWEEIPEHQFVAFLQRLELVEILVDDTISMAEKKEIKQAYMHKHCVSDRTIRGYVHKYRKKGSRGLLFWRPKSPCPRVKDKDLGAKIISLVKELPSRSVPQLRRLLCTQDEFREKISAVSDRTIYRFLAENGLGHAERCRLSGEQKRNAYGAFTAPHSMALVQGDARDGIWIIRPDGKRIKTYLFLWIDDYSRKILFGKYYTNEKLPCMEDSFRHMVLRYGIPAKVYLDNGKVYISRHFAFIMSELKIKKIHHKPYQAHCKGKVEADMKTVERQFQQEAALCNITTLEELNSAFWAWCDVYYNRRVHSTTGQTPDERFLDGLPTERRRITDIEWFNSLFLWRENRKVTKYGKVKLFGNIYQVSCVPYRTVVQVRFDPFDLAEIYIYDHKDHFLEKTWPSKQVNRQVKDIPEESRKTRQEISQDSVRYFDRLRREHLQMQKESGRIDFSVFDIEAQKEVQNDNE